MSNLFINNMIKRDNEDKFYEFLEEIFSKLIESYNEYLSSKIIQENIYNIFESQIYSIFLTNFFSNLVDKNFKPYNLKSEEITKFKKEFKYVLADLESEPNFPFKTKINHKYYNKFKEDLFHSFPNLMFYLFDFEKELGLSRVDEYLAEKLEVIKNSGEEIKDINVFTMVKALEKFSNGKKYFPSVDDPELIKVLENLQKDDNIVKEFLDNFSGMELKDWDIWHSYSSYFLDELVNSKENLSTIATRLVNSEICPLVVSSNVNFWYKENGEVKKSKFDIKELKLNKAQFKVLKRPKEGYSLNLLEQSFSMWHSEWKLFSDEYRDSYPYIRCYLNACYLKFGLRTRALYPQIKIYSNGVFILSFREISSKESYYLEPFIENEINIPNLDLDNILVPPELLKQANLGSLNDLPLFELYLKRDEFREESKKFKELIDSKTQIKDDGDFTFKITPMNIYDEGYKLTLFDLIELIIHNLFFAVNRNNRISRIETNYIGGFTLRPSVYILDYKDQPITNKEILTKFGEALGKIMARSTNFEFENVKKFLDKNLRIYPDYTLHMNQALTLWTMSKKGLEQLQDDDPNRHSIILEKQVQVESIEHLYMSHERLFEISSMLTVPYKSVLKDQLRLLDLESIVTDKMSKFGEISEIIKYADEELKWSRLRNLIEKKLEIRSEYSNEERTKSFRELGYLITILFGITGVATFSNDILPYVWAYYNLWLPNNISKELFLFIISVLLLLIPLIVYIFIKNRDKVISSVKSSMNSYFDQLILYLFDLYKRIKD